MKRVGKPVVFILVLLIALISFASFFGISTTYGDVTRTYFKDGITKLRRSMAIQLSGGEKRRLTIARAIATSPKLLMLDEPFSGVDPIAVSDIQKIVMEPVSYTHLGLPPAWRPWNP